MKIISNILKSLLSRNDGEPGPDGTHRDGGGPIADAEIHTLLAAAEAGELGKVREFISDPSSDLSPRAEFGLTPLMLAARGGHAPIVLALLEAGVDASFADPVTGINAIRLAAMDGDVDTLTALLDHGAHPDQTTADTAIGEPHEHSDATPLMWAASRRHIEAVKLLLARGADLDRQTSEGETALMYCQSPEIIHCLIAAGADVTLCDNEGKTALEKAKFQLLYARDPQLLGSEERHQLWTEIVAALEHYDGSV